MMFLILDKSPVESIKYLLRNTNKKYLAKQVLELLQLVCSAGYSKVYKKVSQGKDIQKIPTNTELPIKEAIEEYKKYLKWKIETNPKYFKGDIR